MDRRQFLTAAAASITMVAGCSGTDGSRGERENREDASIDATVVMRATSYQPSRIEVGTGATVEWKNEDDFAHSVTSAQFHEKAESWSIDEQVASMARVTHTFDSTGAYEYYCTIHGKETMCGVVLVGDVTLDKSLPCRSQGTEGTDTGSDDDGSDGGGGGGYY